MRIGLIVRWHLRKLIAALLFILWLHLALQCAGGADATMLDLSSVEGLAAVTVMIVIIEIGER